MLASILERELGCLWWAIVRVVGSGVINKICQLGEGGGQCGQMIHLGR